MNNLQWLQKFYLSNCNEDWEHIYGISIATLDNPGWRIDIDLRDMILEGKKFKEMHVERNNNDWTMCRVENNVFKGDGGPENLEEIIGIFRNWATENGCFV